MPADVLEQPRIDPRFTKRWVEARQQENRRRRRLVLAVVGVVGVAALVVGLLYSPVLGVRHVRISVAGQGPVTTRQIQDLAGFSGHRLMIDVSGGDIAARLDGDPWLAAAAAQRRWPGTVTIEVTERQPLAQVQVEGAANRWVEIDVTGRVLELRSAKAPGLAVLAGAVTGEVAAGSWIRGGTGPTAPAEGIAPWVEMNAQSDSPEVPQGATAGIAVLAALPAQLRPQVRSVSVEMPGHLLLQMVSGAGTSSVAVDLGDGSQLAAKVAALVTLDQHGDLYGGGPVDLTVPARPVVSPS